MSNELLDPRLPPLVRIVDDDDRVRQSEAFVLRLEGFDVREYSSAEDFLHFDDVSRAGCIVLDIRMPGMNGLELQSELLRTGRSLPILFLTGHGDVAMAVDALKRGAADFIQKPVKAERLAALTHELVAWHQQYTQRLIQRRHAIEKLKALTPKELEVCRLAASGLSNKAIAKELGIAEQTVRIHRWSAAKKLGGSSAVAFSRAIAAAESESDTDHPLFRHPNDPLSTRKIHDAAVFSQNVWQPSAFNTGSSCRSGSAARLGRHCGRRRRRRALRGCECR